MPIRFDLKRLQQDNNSRTFLIKKQRNCFDKNSGIDYLIFVRKVVVYYLVERVGARYPALEYYYLKRSVTIKLGVYTGS